MSQNVRTGRGVGNRGPSSLEWSLEVFPLPREQGLSNTCVTNGCMTPEALELLVESGLDAVNVDVRGDAEAVRRWCGADVAKVRATIRLLGQCAGTPARECILLRMRSTAHSALGAPREGAPSGSGTLP